MDQPELKHGLHLWHDPRWAYRRPAVERIYAAVRKMLMRRLETAQ